jgi:hypothetical protein
MSQKPHKAVLKKERISRGPLSLSSIQTHVDKFFLCVIAITNECVSQKTLIEKEIGYFHPKTGEFVFKSGNVFIKE